MTFQHSDMYPLPVVENFESPEFVMQKADVSAQATKYACCADKFQTVTYSFYIERKSHYYVAQAVVPAVLMAFVTYGSFFMNRAVGPARTAVCMTAILMQITLRIVTSKWIPVSGKQMWLEQFQSGLLYCNILGLVEWMFVQYLIMEDVPRCCSRLTSIGGQRDETCIQQNGMCDVAVSQIELECGVLPNCNSDSPTLEPEKPTKDSEALRKARDASRKDLVAKIDLGARVLYIMLLTTYITVKVAIVGGSVVGEFFAA